MSLLARTWTDAADAAHDLHDRVGLVGYGVIELHDTRGRLILARPFANLISDAGDQYLAKKIIVGTGPAAPTAPTVASGMKLGTGTAATAKSGSGAALGAYITASNLAFDTLYAQSEDLGAGNGWNSVFKSTWAAGIATNTAITEAVIVNDAAANATSTAANTYSRTVFTAINKGASDSMAITWKWKSFGG